MIEELTLGHHAVALLCEFGVFLSIGPILLLKIDTCLETIDDTLVGRVLVGTLIVSEILFGSVEILEHELESLVPSHTLLVAGLFGCSYFVCLDRCQRIVVLRVWLLCIHTAEVEIEHGAHGIGNADAMLVCFVRLSVVGGATGSNDLIAVVDPTIVKGPRELTDGIAGGQVIDIAVPSRVRIATRGHDILSLHITREEERCIAIVPNLISGSSIQAFARQVAGKVRDQAGERTGSIAYLLLRRCSVLWCIFLYTAGKA